MIPDLTIALRVSPILNKSHVYFASKYSLVEASFNSLVDSLDGVSCEFKVILDNCPGYEAIFRQRIDQKRLEIVHTGGVGNVSTYLCQIHLLLNEARSEYIYFAEDDYYYVGKMSEILAFMGHGNSLVDFVTPYDHPDYYRELHEYQRAVAVWKNRKWKEVSSTTLTFLTSRSTALETKRMLELFSAIGDFLMWNILTRKTPAWRYVQQKWLLRHYRELLLFSFYAARNHGHRAY